MIKVHKSWKVHTTLPKTEVPGDLGLVLYYLKEGTSYDNEVIFLFTAEVDIKCEIWIHSRRC